MEIFELTRAEIINVMEMASRADAEDKTFRIAKNGRGLSFKVGEGTWTLPFGVYGM